ncbi:hypothetical protein KKG63_01030 [Patescibacteria group bacterium]|nr:hypothetical protein [Patescibacteria group bacterium]
MTLIPTVKIGVQWRNLNYYPGKYFMQIFGKKPLPEQYLGIKNLIKKTAENFPHIKHGYFNPPKEKF